MTRYQRSRLIVMALIGAGLAVVVVAAIISMGGEDNDITISQNEAIDRLYPNRGDEVLQQSAVGLDLAPGYRMTSLVIYPNASYEGGVEVIREVDVVAGLNQFTFTPTTGATIEFLAGDTNCAIAKYVLLAREDDELSIDWCFQIS